MYEYELLDGEAVLTYRGERHFCAAQGTAGGGAGGLAFAEITRADGGREVIASKIVTTLRKGDRLVIATAGGGGWGAPEGRDAARVEADLRDGKVGAR